MMKRSLILPAMAAGLLLPMTPPLVGIAKPAIVKPAKDWAAHEKMLLANFLPGMMPSFNRAVAGVAATAWNPSDKSAALTLSNNDTTATNPASNNWRYVKAITSYSTGKFYCELKIDAMPTATDWCFGFSNSTTPTVYLGADNNALGILGDGRIIFNNSIKNASWWTSAVGDYICMSVDYGAQKVWYRLNGGNWNNNGSADPAAGTGAQSFVGLNAGPYFMAHTQYGASYVSTVNFGNSAFAFSAPSGFGNP